MLACGVATDVAAAELFPQTEAPQATVQNSALSSWELAAAPRGRRWRTS